MNVELAIDLSELDRLTEAVESFCSSHGVPEDACMQLTLVLEELFTNLVMHGFDGTAAADQRFGIAFRNDDHRVSVEISDRGKPFDPLQALPPDLSLGSEDRPIGGLGLHFLRQMMSDLKYRRHQGRNVLRFTKSWSTE